MSTETPKTTQVIDDLEAQYKAQHPDVDWDANDVHFTVDLGCPISKVLWEAVGHGPKKEPLMGWPEV